MKNRRELLLTLTAALVAAAVIITPVIADELFGIITKVDPDGMKVTVATKGGDEVEIKTTASTEIIVGKGEGQTIDLEKLEKFLKKAKEADKKVFAKVTHEDKVASKIRVGGFAKKKESN
jgi:hypothetical protein